MGKKQFIELLGKETILKFELLSEGVVGYETVMPKFNGNWYVNYRVELYYSQNAVGLHCYNTIEDLLNQMEIYSVVEMKENKNEVTIYKK